MACHRAAGALHALAPAHDAVLSALRKFKHQSGLSPGGASTPGAQSTPMVVFAATKQPDSERTAPA